MKNYIQIKGAKENNLKSLDIDIPKGKLVVITGISGSGKSSLIYDTIYKEAQRVFALSMDSTSRRLLKSYQQVDVKSISGLSPVIAVNQKTISSNSGSTLGTISGIYDLLRLLMARFGKSNIDIKPLKQERRLFSFNTPYGACKSCRGLGLEEKIDVNKLIKDPNLSLREGALTITTPSGYTIYSQVTIEVMNQVCNVEGFDVDTPWNELSDENRKIILYGSNKIKIPFGKHSLESRMKWSGITAKPREEGYYRGIIPIMEEILKRDRNANILRFVKSDKCSDCNGARLNQEALSFRFYDNSIDDLSKMSIEELYTFFKNIDYKDNNIESFNTVRHQIINKAKLLIELGLGYLTINRSSSSLSMGESQRIRFANMTQNKLSGLLYIFDEPSIGLHSADLAPLKRIIRNIVDKGNTVLLIEHEKEMIQIADWIIDIGPKAGIYGGELIFTGSYKEFINNEVKNSITREYLIKESSIPKPIEVLDSNFLEISNANINNLKSIDVKFKLNSINVVCGVSGSGKSSLVMDTLFVDFTAKDRKHIKEAPNLPKSIIAINQKPIGKTPRSNPATYTKIFDKIRALFAKTSDAKDRKLKSNHFSFNTKGGRCEACQGAGYNLVGMHFIGNVELKCEVCNGARFKKSILEVKYKGLSINEVLNLKIDTALEFFSAEKEIHRMLQVLVDIGLGYLELGQRSTSLSGGEAQRIKLASEMMKKTNDHTIYLLDEPSTGLHSYDVEILLRIIHKLKNKGHTIIIIEHQDEIIRNADYIIELGPKSGKNGGNIVFEGWIKDFWQQNSITAQCISNGAESAIKEQSVTENTDNFIKFQGVKTHNLKSVNISIPKNKLIVFTGISGSGKSSMAIDTIFNTANLGYLETFPNYVRSRLNNKSDADFENYSGLTACVNVDHKRSTASLRSTIGTYTGINDLYRLLFSRIAKNSNNELCNCESGFFSFNKQESACQQCKGLGEISTANPNAFIDNPHNSIFDNAISKSNIAKFYIDENGQYYWTLKALNSKLSLNLEKPWNELDEKTRNTVLFGNNEETLEVEWQFKNKTRKGSHKFTGKWKGLVNLIDDEYQRKHADKRSAAFSSIIAQVPCPSCNGKRLNNNALEYKINNLSIAEISELSISESILLFQKWRTHFSKSDRLISTDIIDEILEKLISLNNLELGYLQLNRNINSISGGELQRIIITGSIASNISGVTYIFDEPTRALHPKNKIQVLQHLNKLTKAGNTVIAIEHDTEFIKSADWVIEFGPEAGNNGGEIINECKGSEYIAFGNKSVKSNKKKTSNSFIKIDKANANNLKNINLSIPLNQTIGICGVSGSGKTSLIKDVIYKSFIGNSYNKCNSILGFESFDKCVFVNSYLESSIQNQTIIAYLGMFDPLKRLMSTSNQTKGNKIKPNFFSYASKDSKCPECNGNGTVNVKMDFITDIEEICPECNGSRYLPEVLEYKYNGLNISEILNLQISNAAKLLSDSKEISKKLSFLDIIGLSYLQLGQKLKHLSLGELQRIKLIKYLVSTNNSRILFLLDEPSKGLSNFDIDKLFTIFNEIEAQNHSIIMVEHHAEVLKQCDYLIELGPGAADKGGEIIAQGSIEEIIKHPDSIIGEYL